MSYETRYAAAIRAKTDRAANTFEAQNARTRLRIAMRNAQKDVHKAYPQITAQNAEAVATYQADRIDYWRRALDA